jgi:hypothetical protein
MLTLLGLVVGLGLAYALAHCALIETGREVIVLRTQNEDGSWLETRLWIVDDGNVSWLHGDARSRWERNLEARPVVEVSGDGGAVRGPEGVRGVGAGVSGGLRAARNPRGTLGI